MIVKEFGAAYSPQTVYSPTRTTTVMPLAPRIPTYVKPTMPRTSPYPPKTYPSTQPVNPPVTTPMSADVYAPTKTYAVPTYAPARPVSPTNPYGIPTRWNGYPDSPLATADSVTTHPSVVAEDVIANTESVPTATEPTAEVETGELPAGSIEAQLEAQAAPWYKRPLPLVGLTVGGGLAIVGAILLLRK